MKNTLLIKNSKAIEFEICSKSIPEDLKAVAERLSIHLSKDKCLVVVNGEKVRGKKEN